MIPSGMSGLDRHITGNWGEDSVPPEFLRAYELGTIEPGTVIDISSPDGPELPVTVVSVEPGRASYWIVRVKELAFPLQIKSDATVIYYAELPDGNTEVQ